MGFNQGISRHAPCRDRKVCERVRNIGRKEIAELPNKNVEVHVVKNSEITVSRLNDLFLRIKESDELNKPVVMILPQPHPQYRQLADICNRNRVSCRNLWTFNMDEWADEDGNEAPETWPRGFMYAMLNNFYHRLDPKLRPERKQMHGLTKKNLPDYAKMMEDAGGVDLCDGGIGWSGHVAFIEPNAEEFAASAIEEYLTLGPRHVRIHSLTLAQTSLDADYGMSGDWSSVPACALTIGPAQVVGARLRHSWNHFLIAGTPVSWQRFSVRLALHGPVSMSCPASILQKGPTRFYISEEIAADILDNPEASFYG